MSMSNNRVCVSRVCWVCYYLLRSLWSYRKDKAQVRSVRTPSLPVTNMLHWESTPGPTDCEPLSREASGGTFRTSRGDATVQPD